MVVSFCISHGERLRDLWFPPPAASPVDQEAQPTLRRTAVGAHASSARAARYTLARCSQYVHAAPHGSRPSVSRFAGPTGAEPCVEFNASGGGRGTSRGSRVAVLR